MRARRLLPLLLVLAAVGFATTGCFSSKVADTTISGEITVGQGTTAKTVDVSTDGGGSTTVTTDGGNETTSDETTTDGNSGADVAAGKTAFVSTCGGCHSLKDAGTSGSVGPNLDDLAPLTVEKVADQIEHGGGAMPAKLLEGKDAANVAAYVASVAGK